MPRTPSRLRVGLALLAATACRFAAAADRPIDFDRDVRPIFSGHCTACHGGVKKAGGISFLARETAVAEGESGERAIVPGEPDSSEMIRRVSSADEDERMPPPEHGRGLTAAEIDTLRRWIADGAEWRAHWSFEPPADTPPPAVKNAAWPRVPLDAFVAARLDAEGLAPSPPAGAAEWLRRVSLDLTGLPPSLDDFEAFTADGGGGDDPAAVLAAKERAVERLLASPRFGERWASVWLDLARYADTFGFEKDPERKIWPWRDWVIRAFNDDMPFDRFTVRQLAGDLLPDATTDDLLATAFHRNTQTNTEGGTDDEEFRTAAVLDRVNTTWTAWQATTFGCVQCHSHPYDPFPHDSYYRFAAYFNGSEDRDLADEFPTLPVPDDAKARAEVAPLERAIHAGRLALNADGGPLASDAAGWKPLAVKAAATTGGTIAVVGDGRLKAGGTLPVGVRYDLDVELPPGTTAIRVDLALESGKAEAAPPERGAVISHLTVAPPAPATPEAPAPGTPAPEKPSPAAEVRPATGGRPTADGKPAAEAGPTTLAIAEVFADSIDGPYDPRASLDADAGGFGGFPVMDRPRWCVFAIGDPERIAAGGPVRIAIVQSAASNMGTQACTLRDFRLSVSTDPRWTGVVRDPDRKRRWADLAARRESLAALGGTKVPVLRDADRAARRHTHVFTRGNRLNCGAAVEPGIPAVVRPPETMPADRLGMAEWLVGDTNPLAARVLANRLWAEMFGTGIVETLEDFGGSGGRPSHPHLLDHLAVRLKRAHRWSVKKFLREIALSATYGQTARATPALVERDPRNRLLARGPRNRLTAEMVRDQALAWSGLLAPAMFGPPVFPPQPDSIWRSAYSGETWKTSTGPDRYRRSVYTFVKRTAGYPAMLAFDAPSRDLCSARRIPTNTPLQPLVTLNDPMFMELAAGMAARMEAAGGSARDRIAFGCRLVTLEPPPATMIDPLADLHASAVADGRTEQEALGVVAAALINLDLALVR